MTQHNQKQKKQEGRPPLTRETESGTEKYCPKCKDYHPADLDHFYNDSRSKTGLSSWCRDCQRSAVSNVPSEAKPESLDNDTKPDTCLVIDFTDHEDLLADIKAAADEYFRTPENQVLWWIYNRNHFIDKECNRS